MQGWRVPEKRTRRRLSHLDLSSGLRREAACQPPCSNTSVTQGWQRSPTLLSAARGRIDDAMAQAPAPWFVLRAHTAGVQALAFGVSSGQPDLLATGSADGQIRVWDLASRRCAVVARAHGGKGILGLEFLPGRQLMSQGRDVSKRPDAGNRARPFDTRLGPKPRCCCFFSPLAGLSP